MKHKGQSFVEFALFLPLLLLILAGVLDLGRVMAVKVILANASREGARVAANGATIGEIQQAVIAEPLDLLKIATGNINVSFSTESVTVTAGYSLPLVTGYIFGLKSIYVTSATTFPILRVESTRIVASSHQLPALIPKLFASAVLVALLNGTSSI